MDTGTGYVDKPPPTPTSPSTDAQWAPLFSLCPIPHHPGLTQLILSLPLSSLASFYAQVYQWFIESILTIMNMNFDRFYCPIRGCSQSCDGDSPPFPTQSTLLRHLNSSTHDYTYHLTNHTQCAAVGIFTHLLPHLLPIPFKNILSVTPRH